MANDSTANVKVIVDSNLDDVNKQVNRLYASLKQAADAAQKFKMPGPTRAAQAGLDAQSAR